MPFKEPTHVVIAGFFEAFYLWVTKFCVPFFDEESAVRYAESIKESYASGGWQFIVMPFSP